MRGITLILPLAPLLLVGCVGVRSPQPQAGVVRSSAAVVPAYTVGCPDVLAVRFAHKPQLDCLAAVDLDGRLPISETIRPQVEGHTLEDARLAAAAAAGCNPEGVSVQLAEARTGRVYLFGPERNRQRTVPHLGAETLLDFLYRTGSLQKGCSDLRDVCVLRPNVASGGRPEVFRANLGAVVNGDWTTNIPLEPGDQVYVGETRRSSFARLLPDWLKPTYCKLFGVKSAEPETP